MNPLITPGEVLDYATQFGYSDWSDRTAEEQLRICWEATEDVSEALGYLPESADQLINALILQALFINRTYDSRRVAENINSISSGSFSDGVVTVSGGATRRLSPMVKTMVRNYKRAKGINTEYARG